MSVYTTIDKKELEQFLHQYDVGSLVEYSGISAGIENTNYYVTTTRSDFVLTIFEHHSLDELRYYLNLMHHLAEHKVPSADPVADKNGRFLLTMKNKPAALVKRLQGKTASDVNANQCQQLGRALGKMHTSGLSFVEHMPNPRGISWMRDTAKKLQPVLSENDVAILIEEIDYQRGHRDIDLPRGVIHADLFRDNSLWSEDKLSGIIDFYYACDDALLYDVAITVNDWCSNDDATLETNKVKALLSAYHEVRPLIDAEHEYWPVMLRAGALRFWMSRLFDMHFPRPGEMTHTKDPSVFKNILLDRKMQLPEIRF